MNKLKELKIGYGVMLPTIAEQLAEQGLEIDRPEAYESRREAINRLMFADILTDSQIKMALKKLHKQITQNVRLRKDIA